MQKIIRIETINQESGEVINSFEYNYPEGATVRICEVVLKETVPEDNIASEVLLREVLSTRLSNALKAEGINTLRS